MNRWDTKTAEWYAEKYGDYATNRLGVSALNLAEDSTVVDIGCGTGCALRHAAEQVTRGALIGIDPVPRMVEIAREQSAKHAASDRIVFHEGSAEDLPVKDNFANVVFAFDSFDHWHDQVQGLNEVRRILKPGGQFVVVKDGGLPNGREARDAFYRVLSGSGFEIVKERDVEEGIVRGTVWICSVEK